MTRLHSSKRGQALVELALIMPIVMGLFGVVLQVGVVASDQVSLEHGADEGLQWAEANSQTATTADIGNHILVQLCGSDSSKWFTAAASTRFCRTDTPNRLTVDVTPRQRTTSWLPRLVVDAEAAPKCKAWTLTVTANGTSQSSAQIAQGGSAVTYTVSLNVSAGVPSEKDPNVTLSLTGFPAGVLPAFPIFTPGIISSSSTATVSFAASAATPPGPYSLQWGGKDQCGNSAAVPGNLLTSSLTVTGTAPSTPCSSPPNPGQANPGVLTLVVSTTQTVTINGSNFQNGATVTFGSYTSPLVVFTGSNLLTATVPPAIPPGVYTISVTNPDSCVGSYSNGLTVCTSSGGGSCPSPAPSPTRIPSTCAGSSTLDYETVITVSWREGLVIPWITPSVLLQAVQTGFCQ